MNFIELLTLRRVAEKGSFSAAARLEGVTVSTVSRRLQALEKELDLKLVERSVRGVRLTKAGRRLADLAQPVLHECHQLRATVAGLKSDSIDPVVISATEFVTGELLAPALAKLYAVQPDINVELRSDAGVVSLAAGEAHLAVRMTRPVGASLRMRKLGELPLGLFADDRYLAGRSTRTLDLEAERLIVYDASYGRLPELDALGALGLPGRRSVRAGSTRALLEAAQNGVGIALLPRPVAARAGLTEIPLPKPLPTRVPWLVINPEWQHAREIRATARWIVAVFDDYTKRRT
jgi:DNA-binding transcriptional LysR family regulator